MTGVRSHNTPSTPGLRNPVDTGATLSPLSLGAGSTGVQRRSVPQAEQSQHHELHSLTSMAIAYSAPVYERPRRRERRFSQALSTHINTQVTFPDLSLKSQVIYLAMLETWRVIKEITQEEVEVVYQEDKKETNSDEEESSTGYLMEEILAELEDRNNTEDIDEVDTKIERYEKKQTMYDKNAAARHVLPDLIIDHSVHSGEGEEKLAGLDLLPDIVACSQSRGRGDEIKQPCQDTIGQNNLSHRRELKKEDEQNSDFGGIVSVKLSPEEDDLCKTEKGQQRMIPGKAAQESSKSSWAQTRRQLARVAEQARGKRSSPDSSKHHGDREDADAADPAYPAYQIGPTSHGVQMRMESSEQYSDLLCSLAFTGILYLVRKIIL